MEQGTNHFFCNIGGSMLQKKHNSASLALKHFNSQCLSQEVKLWQRIFSYCLHKGHNAGISRAK